VERLADAWLTVELRRQPDSEVRTATLVPHGGDWDQRLSAVL
jgi:tRNA threonylcarbamoyladenosine biosynthesis protein TsaE